jgi:hypothetical protein
MEIFLVQKLLPGDENFGGFLTIFGRLLSIFGRGFPAILDRGFLSFFGRKLV